MDVEVPFTVPVPLKDPTHGDGDAPVNVKLLSEIVPEIVPPAPPPEAHVPDTEPPFCVRVNATPYWVPTGSSEPPVDVIVAFQDPAMLIAGVDTMSEPPPQDAKTISVASSVKPCFILSSPPWSFVDGSRVVAQTAPPRSSSAHAAQLYIHDPRSLSTTLPLVAWK
jgi:hypothetical protein